MTAVSSTAQDDYTPLHRLCLNESVTLEMIQALGAFHPAAAGEKDNVRRRARSTRARYDRRSLVPTRRMASRRCTLSAETRASRSR